MARTLDKPLGAVAAEVDGLAVAGDPLAKSRYDLEGIGIVERVEPGHIDARKLQHHQAPARFELNIPKEHIMAIVEVKVPQLSESVAEATLLTWKKQPGEAVAIDEILIEIETDKVVLEVPAPAAGVISAHVVASGGTVVSDQLIAQIDTEGKAGPAAPAAHIGSRRNCRDR